MSDNEIAALDEQLARDRQVPAAQIIREVAIYLSRVAKNLAAARGDSTRQNVDAACARLEAALTRE